MVDDRLATFTKERGLVIDPSPPPPRLAGSKAFAPGRCACDTAVLSVPEGTLPWGPRSKLGNSHSLVETSTSLTLGYEASLCSIRTDNSVFIRNFIFNSVRISGETKPGKI